MTGNVAIRTVFPILFLIGIGFLSRKFGALKSGDERVFSAYVYYFALPALFFIELAETSFVSETLSFIFAGIIPVCGAAGIYILLYFLFKFSKNTLYLLIVSTVLGSLAFFGIPFIMFAFDSEQTQRLATLAAGTVGIVAIAISIMVLELYRFGEASKWKGLRHVATRLSRNPLIISIVAGILVSLVGAGNSFSVVLVSAFVGSHHIRGCCFYVGGFSLRKEVP